MKFIVIFVGPLLGSAFATEVERSFVCKSLCEKAKGCKTSVCIDSKMDNSRTCSGLYADKTGHVLFSEQPSSDSYTPVSCVAESFEVAGKVPRFWNGRLIKALGVAGLAAGTIALLALGSSVVPSTVAKELSTDFVETTSAQQSAAVIESAAPHVPAPVMNVLYDGLSTVSELNGSIHRYATGFVDAVQTSFAGPVIDRVINDVYLRSHKMVDIGTFTMNSWIYARDCLVKQDCTVQTRRSSLFIPNNTIQEFFKAVNREIVPGESYKVSFGPHFEATLTVDSEGLRTLVPRNAETGRYGMTVERISRAKPTVEEIKLPVDRSDSQTTKIDVTTGISGAPVEQSDSHATEIVLTTGISAAPVEVSVSPSTEFDVITDTETPFVLSTNSSLNQVNHYNILLPRISGANIRGLNGNFNRLYNVVQSQ